MTESSVLGEQRLQLKPAAVGAAVAAAAAVAGAVAAAPGAAGPLREPGELAPKHPLLHDSCQSSGAPLKN